MSVEALLAALPGGPWAVTSASQLPGYANALAVFEATSASTGVTRKLVAKWFSAAADLPPARLARRLETQAALARHVAAVAAAAPGGAWPSVAVPAPLADDGRVALETPGPDGGPSLAQLLDHVDSVRLYDALRAAVGGGSSASGRHTLLALCQGFGLALGGMSRALQGARPAVAGGAPRVLAGCCDGRALAPGAPPSDADDRVSSWDPRHFPALASDVGHIANAAAADAVRSVFALWEADVAPHYAATEAALAAGAYDEFDVAGPAWQLGWTHGDPNNHNVLLCAPAAAAVGVGGTPSPSDYVVIDWEDCGYGYSVHDAAVAVTYLLLDAGGVPSAATLLDAAGSGGGCPALDAAAAFLRAYSQPLPLRPSEVAALPSLVAVRLATSLLHSAKAAAAATSDAQREYVLVHAAPARALLALLIQPALRAALRQRFVDATGLTTTVTRPPRSYVYRPQPSAAQARASALAAAALRWLGAQQVAAVAGGGGGRAGQLAPVIAHDPAYRDVDGGNSSSSGTAVASAAASAAGKAGVLPPAHARHFASPAGWWPRAPFVYDFSARNAAVADVVGTDAAKLAAFTELMFAPLRAPVAAAAPESKAHGDVAPPAPALTPLPAASSGVSSGAGVYRIGWGQYGEDRVLYTSGHFTGGGSGDDGDGDAGAAAAPAAAEARSLHLGVDLEAAAGTPVHAPLAGVVHSTARNLHPLDYGPTVILRHTLRVATTASVAEEEVTFYTLYGHLSVDTIVGPDGAPRLAPGTALPAGAVVGWVGPEVVNGGWPPHLHFQINTEQGDMGGWRGDYPGVAARSDWPHPYRALCPDPNTLLLCPWVAPVGWAPVAAAPGGDGALLAVPVEGGAGGEEAVVRVTVV